MANNGRIKHKHDTWDNWLKATNFIPLEGEIIIYDGDETHCSPRIKIGDGETTVNNLPFSTFGESTPNIGEIFNDYERNIADKDCHAEGSGTEALRGYAHAEGFGTKAYWRSHAQGFYTHARADSMAGGRMSFAAGPGSVAFGIEWNNDVNSSIVTTMYDSGVLKLTDTTIYASFTDALSVGDFICLDGRGECPEDFDAEIPYQPRINILTDARKIVEITEFTHDFGGELTTGLKIIIDRPFYEPLQPTYSNITNQETFKITSAIIKKASPCEATGVASFSFGCGTKASGNRAFTSGQETVAAGSCSSAMNNKTQALGDNSHAEGNETIAGMEYYKADSDGNYLNKDDEITTNPEEYVLLRTGSGAHAEGYATKALANYSHAEGRKTQVTGAYAHAEGNETLASGESSHAEGGGSAYNENGVSQKLVASGIYSHAEGQGTTSSARASHSEGRGSLAEGEASHAEGFSTHASHQSSHAEGYSTTATDVAAHAEGCDTHASGSYSHAEGHLTIAAGIASHAEGYDTFASGSYSHAEGQSTFARGPAQHVQGRYNKIDTDFEYAHIVGNGSSDTDKHNAHTLDWSGNAWFSGDVYVGGSDQSDGKVLACKDYVDNLAEQINTLANNIGSGNQSVQTGVINILETSLNSGRINAIETPNLYVFFDGISELDYITGVELQGTSLKVMDDSPATVDDLEQYKGSYIYLIDNQNQRTPIIQFIDYQRVDNYFLLTTTPFDFTNNTFLKGSYRTVYVLQNSGSATGKYATAFGYNSFAQGEASHAEGSDTNASGFAAHAEGSKTSAAGPTAHAEGYNTQALTKRSHAEGESTIASGDFSHVEGIYSKSSGNASHAEGRGTIAASASQHVHGRYNVADILRDADGAPLLDNQGSEQPANKYATIVGNGSSDTNRKNAHTLDWSGNAWFAGDVFVGTNNTKLARTSELVGIKNSKGAEIFNFYGNGTDDGLINKAHAFYCHAEGYNTVAGSDTEVDVNGKPLGRAAHAEGQQTLAKGHYSHAEGINTQAIGSESHAEGRGSIASGQGSHAEGQGTNANKKASHAEGETTIASGEVSHAEGYNSIANGNYSHAEGNHVIANGDNSHAEGCWTTANGYATHAEGDSAVAEGPFSHAEGYYTQAYGVAQHVHGKNNILDIEVDSNGAPVLDDNGNLKPLSTYATIVGNGISNTERSNAHTLDWDGNAWFAGSVKAEKGIIVSYGTSIADAPTNAPDGTLFIVIGNG